jgi:hypothetical protein
MQIDNWLTVASYQEAASCTYTAHWYAQWSLMAQSWTLAIEEDRVLAVFERKILRKMYGPVKENELWGIRRNDELEDIIKDENIVRFIKSQRIQWLRHLERMQDTPIPKKMLYGKLYATRLRGIPKTRWLDDVSADLRKMGINVMEK